MNTYLKNTYTAIKNLKPWVQFGISPFGVWRNKSVDPKGSDTQAGQTNYDDLYANILLWLKNGWIDYVTPQLYFTIGHPRSNDRHRLRCCPRPVPRSLLIQKGYGFRQKLTHLLELTIAHGGLSG